MAARGWGSWQLTQGGQVGLRGCGEWRQAVKPAVERGLLICCQGSFCWCPSNLSRFIHSCPLGVELNCTHLVLFLVQTLQSVHRRKHDKWVGKFGRVWVHVSTCVPRVWGQGITSWSGWNSGCMAVRGSYSVSHLADLFSYCLPM